MHLQCLLHSPGLDTGLHQAVERGSIGRAPGIDHLAEELVGAGYLAGSAHGVNHGSVRVYVGGDAMAPHLGEDALGLVEPAGAGPGVNKGGVEEDVWGKAVPEGVKEGLGLGCKSFLGEDGKEGGEGWGVGIDAVVGHAAESVGGVLGEAGADVTADEAHENLFLDGDFEGAHFVEKVPGDVEVVELAREVDELREGGVEGWGGGNGGEPPVEEGEGLGERDAVADGGEALEKGAGEGGRRGAGG